MNNDRIDPDPSKYTHAIAVYTLFFRDVVVNLIYAMQVEVYLQGLESPFTNNLKKNFEAFKSHYRYSATHTSPGIQNANWS